MNKLNEYSHQLILLALEYLPKLALALLLLVVGLWLIERVGRVSARAMERREMDLSLRGFLVSLITIALKVLLLVSVAGMIGIETTSFVAVLGAAGLAIGLALQGSLSNFAGGVLILLFKPFTVGDVIEAQGQTGKVKEIQIFNTVLSGAYNKTIIIPNGILANGNIINQSRERMRAAVISLPLDISTDIELAKKVCLQVAKEQALALSEPAPSVRLTAILPDYMQLSLCIYTEAGNYDEVYFNAIEQVRAELLLAGIKFGEINRK